MLGATAVKVVAPGGEIVEGAVYTITQLNQQAAKVLDEINESGAPAMITKRGRFIAMITPLASTQVESIALSEGGPIASVLPSPWVEGESMELLSPDEVRRQLLQ